METLVNMIARMTGVSAKLWSAVDGSKTYMVASLASLTAMLGLMEELRPILAAHDTGALYAFVCALPHDQAWQMLMGGGIAGCLRHALAKAPGAPTDLSSVVPPPPPPAA